jgi:hypothetical protein
LKIDDIINEFKLSEFGFVVEELPKNFYDIQQNLILIQLCKLKEYFNVPSTRRSRKQIFPEKCDLPPNLDPRIVKGFKNLVDVINSKREGIEKRIINETKLWKEEYERQLKEKKERLRKDMEIKKTETSVD